MMVRAYRLGFVGGCGGNLLPEKNFKNTAKPPNKGHIGDGQVVLCKEVVLFSEVLIVLNLFEIS